VSKTEKDSSILATTDCTELWQTDNVENNKTQVYQLGLTVQSSSVNRRSNWLFSFSASKT